MNKTHPIGCLWQFEGDIYLRHHDTVGFQIKLGPEYAFCPCSEHDALNVFRERKALATHSWDPLGEYEICNEASGST